MQLNLNKKKFLSEENVAQIVKIGINFGERLNSIESEIIADYDNTKTYLKGESCYHNNYIYRCKATATGDWDFSRWELIGDEITELTKDDIKDMLGLSDEELETLSKIILDSEVRLDKTYSSSKIYTDIQNAIDTAKAYTLTELGKISGASYKVVTATSDMTDEKVIYLLQNGSNYDMYIVEEGGTVTKIGDTAINLDNYFTKTEITDNYYDKATCDGKFATITTVDGKVDQADLDTHIGDTTIHITQAEKDSYVLKSEVLTMDNVAHIKRFDSVPGNDWNNAIEEGYYAIAFDSVANTIANRPYDYAIQVHVIKADTNDPIFVYQIAYISTSDTRIYIRKQKIDGSWTPWERICTTSIEDIPPTTITNFDSSIFSGTISYEIKSGICYAVINNFSSTSTVEAMNLCDFIPPKMLQTTPIISDVTGEVIGLAYIFATKLQVHIYKSGKLGYASFSYPVSES